MPIKMISMHGNTNIPYPEPVYTGRSSVLEWHWSATGWPSVHCDTTGDTNEYLQGTTALEKFSWYWPTLECRWRDSDSCSLHWNTTVGL